jgi:hypothetical protein
VNVLVALEILKSGFGWSDRELYNPSRSVPRACNLLTTRMRPIGGRVERSIQVGMS